VYPPFQKEGRGERDDKNLYMKIAKSKYRIRRYEKTG
jgi:hypothetical protein